MKIYADIQRLEPGELVELFELDATAISGDVLRFHGYQQVGSIWWQGNEYTPWPLNGDGFAKTSEGLQPSPRLQVGNVDGSIGALCDYLDDMVGARVIRRRTLGKYLDGANFPDGNPDADPLEELPSEIWYVQQKTTETDEMVEFQLSSPLDLASELLPRRQIIANVCTWIYRSAECGWTGTTYFDANDNLVGTAMEDRCGKRLSSCKCRFGQFEELPFGGFPAADLLRT